MTRYHLLDGWRGAAALWVTLFHCSTALFSWSDGFPAQVLLSGWAGVFVFFPISGYCIAAAIERPDNATLLEYLRRRWRRIFPPYWASIVVVLVVSLAALPFNRGDVNDLSYSGLEWLAMATLTQGFLDRGGILNPVYWSLCYEEQFYLVMASLLVIRRSWRGPTLIAVSLAAVCHLLGWLPTARVPGIFLNHWLEFAAGIGAFYWLHRPSERSVAAGLGLLIAIALAAGDAGAPLAISAAVASLMIALKPMEPELLGAKPVRALVAVGTFSFSLYLVHVPLGGRVVNLLARHEAFRAWPILATGAGVLVSLAGSYAFFRVVERRFLPRPRHAEVPVRAVTAA